MKNSDPSPSLHGDPPAAVTSEGNADRKELASTAFERTRMPMIMTDARQPDHPIVLANKAFLNLTGYSADEVLGKNCRFLQGKGTSNSAIAQIRADLGSDRESDVEILNYRKDGSAFWNKLHISPIHDDEGQLLYHFASQIDVTELRKVQTLEASEHRLLMEVDHRAKNVLAVVDSIVRLSDPKDPNLYAASVQRRVQSLAIAHGMMAENGWRDASLGHLIQGQVEPYAPKAVALTGPEVMITALQVQPLSLVFHELVVNAADHGALRQATGQVAISWDYAPERVLQLRWQESGGVPSRAPVRRGLGAILIDAMIEKQLRGTIDRDWHQEGLTVQIAIPQEESVEPTGRIVAND